jgi:hypothetical protein
MPGAGWAAALKVAFHRRRNSPPFENADRRLSADVDVTRSTNRSVCARSVSAASAVVAAVLAAFAVRRAVRE